MPPSTLRWAEMSIPCSVSAASWAALTIAPYASSLSFPPACADVAVAPSATITDMTAPRALAFIGSPNAGDRPLGANFAYARPSRKGVLLEVSQNLRYSCTCNY